MIVPDINLLVYAYNADAPLHLKAKEWWENTLNDGRPVGLVWAAMIGFVRLMTHPRVVLSPMCPTEATQRVRDWLAVPSVQILNPGPRHIHVLESLLADLGVAAQLTTDAHLAAIAIEYQCELHSNDMDFGRFAGLRWVNPLSR
jgi:toxin-antitoxin system PIN domain toxin